MLTRFCVKSRYPSRTIPSRTYRQSRSHPRDFKIYTQPRSQSQFPSRRCFTQPIGMSTSSFILPGPGDVPVQLAPDLEQDELLAFPAFKNWLATLTHNLSLQQTDPTHPFHATPYTLRGIQIQAIDRFGPKLGFLKLVADLRNPDGERLPGAVFLRGPSVGMLVVLQPDDIPDADTDKHVLLTVQPRVAAGALRLVELPAGMVDDAGEFAGAAAREIYEELGLSIPAGQLTNLSELAADLAASSISASTSASASASSSSSSAQPPADALPRAMFPSPGACDEHITLFLHERRVPRAQLAEWTGRLTGLRDEGEKITLLLVPLADLWLEGARDAKALGAWALYQGLKRRGRI